MRSFFVGISAIYLVVGSALAQTPSTSSPALSLDQQNKISEIVSNRTPQPINHINFVLQRDAAIPADVSLQRLPAEAESVAPELKGYSYLAVEELVAIVDTGSRKVVSVMQRMRRQESTGAAPRRLEGSLRFPRAIKLVPALYGSKSGYFASSATLALNSAENRLRVLMVDRPLHRQIHLNRLSQEAGQPLRPHKKAAS